MPRHSDRARYGRGGLRNVICVSITSLRTRLAFLASFVSASLPSTSFPSRPSHLSFHFSVSFRCTFSPRFFFLPSSRARRPPRRAARRRWEKICVSPRRVQCSKTFMYLLSDDNKSNVPLELCHSRIFCDEDTDSSTISSKETVNVFFVV